MPCETVLQTVCLPHWTSESPTGRKPQQLWKKPLNATVTLLPIIREAIQVKICVFALNVAKALSGEPSWVCKSLPPKKSDEGPYEFSEWEKLLSMISCCTPGNLYKWKTLKITLSLGEKKKILAGNLYHIGPQGNYFEGHFVDLYRGLTVDCVHLIGMRRTVLIVSLPL